ncbi:hypothetical protein LCGC14_1592730, partial [marine sediment metagenome]
TIVQMCEAAGRTVERDFLTGRWKAVPGWDLGIVVPGMKSSEQYAPQKAAGEDRQRISDALVARQEDKINEMGNQIAELIVLQKGQTKPQDSEDTVKEKPLNKMNHDELDAVRVDLVKSGHTVVFTEGCTKADKVAAIEKAQR